jgi:AAA+ superfamily predicted ATPase
MGLYLVGRSPKYVTHLADFIVVFLRHLEYYSGILFLTSNRINTIDPAFQSRIQIAIRYEPPTQLQRECIWESFIRKALTERNISQSDEADIMKAISKLSRENLNGRQIRNIVQLATLLARSDNDNGHRVQLKHINEALNDTLQFQKSIKDGDKNPLNRNSAWNPFALDNMQ